MPSRQKLGRILGNEKDIPKVSAVNVVHLKLNQSVETPELGWH